MKKKNGYMLKYQGKRSPIEPIRLQEFCRDHNANSKKANTNRRRTEVMVLRYETGKAPSRYHKVIFPWWPHMALDQYHSQLWLGSELWLAELGLPIRDHEPLWHKGTKVI